MRNIHNKTTIQARKAKTVYVAMTESLNSHNISYQEQLVIMEQTAHVTN